MNIYQKLIEVRKSCEYLQKSNEGAQYKYVSSSQTLSALKSKMDELGLLLVPKITSSSVDTDTIDQPPDKYGKLKRTSTYFTQLWMVYVWINAENPEEQIVCPWYGQGVDIAGEKGVGKAVTYAEKYFLLKFFNIATDKDDPDSFQKKNEPDPKKPDSDPEANDTCAELCTEMEKADSLESLVAWAAASKPQIDALPEMQKNKVRGYYRQVEAMIKEKNGK